LALIDSIFVASAWDSKADAEESLHARAREEGPEHVQGMKMTFTYANPFFSQLDKMWHSEALAHQSWPSLMPSSGWAVTKHFLTGSTSGQPPLTLVLRTPSKCCSGCSPSPQPCSVPVFGPLPWLDNCPLSMPAVSWINQLYAMLRQGPLALFGNPGPENMPFPRNGTFRLSAVHSFFSL
jgi:hypothetical protein